MDFNIEQKFFSDKVEKEMRKPWNKGYTKETHPSVRKISETMKKRKINNFARWRARAIQKGILKVEFPSLEKDGNLAELIGVVLGDGHICKFPRCESLRIVGAGNNLGFAERYAKMIEKIFQKKPYVAKRAKSNAIDITIYEKEISKRLGIPSGNKGGYKYKIPDWILKDNKNIIRFLRGLYESEGSLCYHPATYTHKFIFSNTNQSLLKNVEKLLKVLGFSPHSDRVKVQISKKDQVARIIELLEFRKY